MVQVEQLSSAYQSFSKELEKQFSGMQDSMQLRTETEELRTTNQQLMAEVEELRKANRSLTNEREKPRNGMQNSTQLHSASQVLRGTNKLLNDELAKLHEQLRPRAENKSCSCRCNLVSSLSSSDVKLQSNLEHERSCSKFRECFTASLLDALQDETSTQETAVLKSSVLEALQGEASAQNASALCPAIAE